VLQNTADALREDKRALKRKINQNIALMAEKYEEHYKKRNRNHRNKWRD
jgi:hypothetical protein